MEAEECKSCPLYRHFSERDVPPGWHFAWGIYRKLTGPAVERFSLHRETWAAMQLDLDAEEMDAVLDDLNEIETGVLEAQAQIAEAERKKNEGKR
jgi:hypothetical protein